MHLETALTEVFHQVELLIFIFAHCHVAEFVSFATLALRLFLCRRLDRLRVLSSKVDGLLHEGIHDEHIKVELLADHFSLLFLASEWVANQAHLHSKPVGRLGMAKCSPLFEVDFDDLFEGVTEQEVVVNLVGDLELGLVEVDLSLATLGWGALLGLGIDLCRRVENLLKLWLVLRHNI